MPHISNAFEQRHRRYSSGVGTLTSPHTAGNSISSDNDRPSSSGNLLSRAQETLAGTSYKPSGSVTVKPVDEESLTDSIEDGSSTLNRWSSSSTTSSTHQRRRSSFTRRFSISTPTFNASGFRATSPTKRRRSSDAQREAPTSDESSPTSLPSLNRFSPLTIPNLSISSFKEEHNTDKPLPPRPAAAVEQSPLKDSSLAQRREVQSPTRRLREPLSRAGSHLSDIQEGSRATTPTPRNPGLTPVLENGPLARGHIFRSGPSREASPRKHDRERSTGRDRGESSRRNEHASSSRHGGKGGSKDKDKKMMLTKALKKANEAVQFDNEQDYVNAVNTYEEACNLLDSVMSRTTAEFDRQKLTTIRSTYMSRIGELQRLVRPRPLHTHQVSLTPSLDQALDEEIAAEEIASHYADHAPSQAPNSYHARHSSLQHRPSRSGSGILKNSRGNTRYKDTKEIPQSPEEREVDRGASKVTGDASSSSTNPHFLMARKSAIPEPLSPARLHHDDAPELPSLLRAQPSPGTGVRPESGIMKSKHTSSWFLGNDDRDSPPSPSSPARSSYDATRLKYLSTGTEPGFATALDEAIEYAYGDYEPIDPADAAAELSPEMTNDPIAQQALSYNQRQVQIQRLSRNSRIKHDATLPSELSDEEDGIGTDEEERLLAEGDHSVTSETTATQSTDVHAPRQSDSSGFSGHTGRTWNSSTASSLNTNGTSLSTVDENASLPLLDHKTYQARVAAPSSTSSSTPKTLDTPQTVGGQPEEVGHRSRSRSPNLRDRRLSAQKAQKLRIETGAEGASPERRAAEDTQKKSQQFTMTRKPSSETQTTTLSKPVQQLEVDQLSSPYPSPSMLRFPSDTVTPPTPGTATFSPDSVDQSSQQTSPDRHPTKSERPLMNKTSSQQSFSKRYIVHDRRTPEELGPSPNTPGLWNFSRDQRPGLEPTMERAESAMGMPLKTPGDATFNVFPSVSTTGHSLYDSELLFAVIEDQIPRDDHKAPKPLEACPESDMLRPWWLLRCFLQTLSHPKGGFLTNRLFVPNDVWKIKNVKLKAIEDKINNCDMLTAALEKLSAVDTLDAEAVLQEMQSFEGVMDHVRTNLTKKLGSDVGPATVSSLFKEAPADSSVPDSTATGDVPAKGVTTSSSSRSSSKNYLNSWKKLRNKSSSTNLSGRLNVRDTKREGMTMNSLPMTESSAPRRSRSVQRDQGAAVKALSNNYMEGPNSNYAGALLRLCEAAQILDAIIRQVEDPGLRHSNKAWFGLELCAHHAATFFSFYVCRFILQDLTMLMEKFVKRATEYVLGS